VPISGSVGSLGRRRLGSGALRAMVVAHLTEHLGRSFTPGEIAHALGGRSTGAIGNALETLVERGQVTCTHTRPRRFAATTSLPADTTSSPPAPAPHATVGAAIQGLVWAGRGAQRAALPPRALADHADVAALQALRATRGAHADAALRPAGYLWPSAAVAS